MLVRLFVIVGGLFVLALTAALVVPYFVDWTSYKADFEREASAVLGRKVSVHGEASARILPFPSVTFTDVVVGEGGGGAPAMTVDTFSMDAELAPFLRGEVLIFDMRLVRPRAVIAVDDLGVVDWAVRPSTPFDPRNVALESVTVTGGEIVVRHAAGGRDHLLSAIDAKLSARSLAGPWRVDGTLQVDGHPTALSASTGAVDEAGAMRLKLRVEPAEFAVAIESDGVARLIEGAPVYAGQFRAFNRPPPAAEGEAAAARPEPGNRVSGDFRLDHARLEVAQFRLETGPVADPYTADGSATVSLGADPRFLIKASGAQVTMGETEQAGQGIAFADRLAALRLALMQLPKPVIPGTVDVSLPAIVAGDTTLRDIRLLASPSAAGWEIESAAATLPGRAKLEAAGTMTVGGDLGFKGSLLLAVGQPSGFAAWLARDVDDAIRRLPAAGFSARVDLSAAHQRFDDLELMLGQAKFRGAVDHTQPADGAASLAVRLDGGALDLDGLAAFASIFVDDAGINRFPDHAVDLALKAGPVSVRGFAAETVDAALRLRGDELEIDRFAVGGLAGAMVSATGSLKHFPVDPVGNLDASLVAVDLKPLVDLAAATFPDNALLAGLARRAAANPGLMDDARIDLVASTARDDAGATGIAVSGKGAAGGVDFTLAVSSDDLADPLGDRRLGVDVTAHAGDASSLLALYGLPVLPLSLLGEATTELSLQGIPAKGLTARASLAGDGIDAGFDGEAKPSDQGLQVSGRARIASPDIEPWLMTAGLSLPGLGLGTAVELESNAAWQDGRLVLGELAGTVGEGAVAGDLTGTLVDGRPHLAGALSLDALDLDPLAATVLGIAALEPGDGVWPETAFQPRAEPPVTADVALKVGALAAGAYGTADNASLKLRLDGEGIKATELDAHIYGGRLSGLFDLKNNDGGGLLSAQLKLADADLSLAVPWSGLAGRADAALTLSSSGKSVGALVAALAGSGSAGLRGMEVPGLDPAALGGLLVAADAAGKDIDAKTVAAFAEPLLRGGSFAGGDADVAFTIAGGVVRAPAVTLTAPLARLTADLRVDLTQATLAGSGSLAYDPGADALVGSEPTVTIAFEGPAGAVSASLDTGPLAQFLTQRALEREQARVEAMQAALLEKQRLRREVRYYAALQAERDRLAELARRAQEDARRKAEEELRAQAAEQARAEAEARRAAEAKAAAEKAAAEQEAAERAAAEQAAAERAAEKAAQERARVEAEAAKAAAEKLERAKSAPAQAPTPQPAPREAQGAAPSRPASLREILEMPDG